MPSHAYAMMPNHAKVWRAYAPTLEKASLSHANLHHMHATTMPSNVMPRCVMPMPRCPTMPSPAYAMMPNHAKVWRAYAPTPHTTWPRPAERREGED